MNIRILILLVISASLVFRLSAQASFRTTAGDVAPDGLYYFYAKQDTPVSVQQDLRSLPYPLQASGPLAFYTLDKGQDGKTLTNVVASVDLSSAGTLPLLMFFKGGQPPAKYRIAVMKEDTTSFPKGACRFMNQSGFPVRVLLGKESFLLAPGSVVDRPNPGQTAQLNLTASPSGPPVNLFMQNMFFDPAKRYLFIMLPDTVSKSGVALRTLEDRL